LSSRQVEEQRMIELFMNDRQMEIIAVVEGVVCEPINQSIHPHQLYNAASLL